MKKSQGYYCKVYYSLLALCYLEVLLWTFCLIASCAAPVHGHSYLIRETQTLKLATRPVHPAVVGSTHLRQPKLLWRFERKSVSDRNAEPSKCFPSAEQSGLLAALRGFTVVATGLPAPYTGIKAISVVSVATINDSVLASNAVQAVAAAPATGAAAPVSKVPLKPVSDVFAGALARAASQSTIHPLDTLKLVPPASAVAATAASSGGGLAPLTRFDGRALIATVGSLYKGVVGAASGAGIAIGAYFAVYGVACNTLSRYTTLPPTTVAFVGGGVAALGSSFVKVPLAVCIRSVQAGVYPNVFAAARSITAAAGPRGLFTGYLPTVLEDVPDMAIKFAAYEGMRQEDFAMGAVAGALAAAATTPLDVIKTNMMCNAAVRPSMGSAAMGVMRQGGPAAFFRGVGARAASNGINSAVFFCFFEALRGAIASSNANRAAIDGQYAKSRPVKVTSAVQYVGAEESSSEGELVLATTKK
ncbi:mitochondrial substrate carrier [Volvox carteri f. nagariensis]|uniref:Mitochondrial substrate carrier n=1 Tax=Volvox carteri f. nagariensis TaxID=3068 RepID=D8U6D0_VOLCA|nr:mitochondrial substrate carrier [Volvox carteri f. nagariensis]EFJ44623.1 mitochondrial substrate carrier [Volvox carteri f. nagariensis]|eukprot:XP_002954199.1 mitochondrial substrate carrier [Volvox carteri f. nagariensis]